MEKEINLRYDVLIIGGGPAGFSAGIRCCKLGLKTLLIDRDKKSNRNTIESIHPGVIQLLEFLDINSNTSKYVKGVYSSVSNGDFAKPLNPNENEDWEGYHISKVDFVEYLREESAKSNLEVLLGRSVTKILSNENRVYGLETERSEKFFAQYIIDCSGFQRVIGKKLNIYEKYYSPKLLVYTGSCSILKKEIESSINAFFIPKSNGWTWIARLSDGTFYWTRLINKENISLDIPDEFDIQKGARIDNVSQMSWRIFRPICKEGMLMCGDSAYSIDPAAGQGIYNSLLSGIKASEIILKCMLKPKSESYYLAEYDRWVFDKFREKVSILREYYTQLEINIEVI